MKLPRKVSIIVAVAFIISGIMSYLIQQFFIMPSFFLLEEEIAIQNTNRILEAIKRELDQIEPSVSDWAYWTDTLEYVKGERSDYPEVNLNYGNTLSSLSMNYLGIYDLNGKSVWVQGFDLNTGQIVELGQLTGKGLPRDHPLLQHTRLDSVSKGIIQTLEAPMLVVAKPILTNEITGPIAGTLIFGRFLNESFVERISNTTKLPFKLTPSTSQWVTSGWRGAPTANQGIVYAKLSPSVTGNKWQVVSTIGDIFGRPVVDLSVITSRKVSKQGSNAVKQSLWMLAATGMSVMLLIWLLLKRTVLEPIAVLTNFAVSIGDDDHLRSRVDIKRSDEVGVLASTFNEMVDRLADTRRRLVDQSYRSGIAEMASGVLHNIGNAITPLNIRLAKLQQRLNAAPLSEVEQATTELADQLTPHDRRKDLVQFVELAAGEMAGLIQTSQKEIELSVQQIGRLHDILIDQQQFSRSARIIEPVDMLTLIREAEIDLVPEMKRLLSIEITPDVSEYGPIAGSHASLRQVVSNILINAAEAIMSTGRQQGKLSVMADQKIHDGHHMVRFSFTDNGVGLTPYEQEQIFARGYSTKGRDGSGYGLHWSANTVQALGGRMSAENVKDENGTCIHVTLPLAEIPDSKKVDNTQESDGL